MGGFFPLCPINTLYYSQALQLATFGFVSLFAPLIVYYLSAQVALAISAGQCRFPSPIHFTPSLFCFLFCWLPPF